MNEGVNRRDFLFGASLAGTALFAVMKMELDPKVILALLP